MNLEHELGISLMLISGLSIYIAIMRNISEKLWDHESYVFIMISILFPLFLFGSYLL